jgi:hypothetical protein
MSIALVVVLGIAMMAIGLSVTFMIASSVPQSMLQRASNHGRFAGLAADDQNGGSGKRVSNVQPQMGNRTINAI